MIKGWVKTTLIDFPGQIASILFLGGCNLRCPMCHNPELVRQPKALPDIPLDDILAHLRKNKGKITGVVVSGGEPCLTPELPSLLSGFKTLDLTVKLDTNGFFPDILEGLLDNGIVDYVAMDIKAPPHKYALLCGLKTVDIHKIQKSLDLITQSGIAHEFRTTVVPTLITEEDVAAIANWLPSQSPYILQQFRPQNCLDPAYNELVPYPSDVLRRMQAIAQETLSNVTVRGI